MISEVFTEIGMDSMIFRKADSVNCGGLYSI